MWNGFKVIDADAHHHEPQDLWARYVEPKFQDRVPRVIGMKRNFFVYAPDQKFSTMLEQGGDYRPNHDQWMADKYGDAYDRWWCPEVLLKDMARFRLDIQVILSTNGNRIMEAALADAEVGLAMARAYHNWCYDYASADSARLKFTATLAAGDSAGMVVEARRAVEQLGAVSVRNPLLPKGKWLHEPDYDGLWQLADDLDFPISLHGESRHLRAAPFRELRAAEIFSALDHIIGFPMDNMVTMAHFIFGGVLERFPNVSQSQFCLMLFQPRR